MRIRIRSFSVPVLLLIGSILLVLLAIEVFLRISGLQPDFFYQLDEEVGGIHIPGKKGWNLFQGERIPIEINSYGYRDVEWSLEKAPGITRVAVLGDSFIEGFQVRREELLTERLEALLNTSCGGRKKFEVMNFGHSGFGTAQELETFRHRVTRLQPSLTLLFFYPSNDLFDNSRELAVEPSKFYFDLDDDGNLLRLPFEVYDPLIKRWLRHHSRTFLFIRDRVKRLGALRRALVRARLVHTNTQISTQAVPIVYQLQSAQYLLDMPPEISRAWQLTEALLSELKRETAESNTWLGVVVIPNREELLLRGPLDDKIESQAFDYRQSLKRISEIASRLDIPLVHLLTAFNESGLSLESLSFYPEDSHWSPTGHRIAAEATFEWIREIACAE